MKWVAACFVVVFSAAGSRLAAAQGAGGTPPTAQFPDAASKPGAAAAAPAPAAAATAPPLGAPPPPPPNGAAYPPEPPPPPPPGAYPPGAYPPGAYPPGAYPPGADAYPYREPPAAPSDSDEVVSLTISPLHLILPIVQLTGEVRVTPHFGVSVIAGYGAVTLDTTSSDGFTTDRTSVSAYEIGGRLVGYPLKKFKSLQLGGQLLYLHLATNGPISNSGVSATGAGVALGPFVGYKLVTMAGFTFFAQGGFQYIAARGDAHDTAGNNASDTASKFGPLLNLDIGWSF